MTQTHCTWCGRELVPARIRWVVKYDGNGEPRFEDVLMCPRFPRSWRNLWTGGVGHDCRFADPNSIVDIAWTA